MDLLFPASLVTGAGSPADPHGQRGLKLSSSYSDMQGASRSSGIISKQLFEVRHKNEHVLIFRSQVLIVSIGDFGHHAT